MSTLANKRAALLLKQRFYEILQSPESRRLVHIFCDAYPDDAESLNLSDQLPEQRALAALAFCTRKYIDEIYPQAAGY